MINFQTYITVIDNYKHSEKKLSLIRAHIQDVLAAPNGIKYSDDDSYYSRIGNGTRELTADLVLESCSEKNYKKFVTLYNENVFKKLNRTKINELCSDFLKLLDHSHELNEITKETRDSIYKFYEKGNKSEFLLNIFLLACSNKNTIKKKRIKKSNNDDDSISTRIQKEIYEDYGEEDITDEFLNNTTYGYIYKLVDDFGHVKDPITNTLIPFEYNYVDPIIKNLNTNKIIDDFYKLKAAKDNSIHYIVYGAPFIGKTSLLNNIILDTLLNEDGLFPIYMKLESTTCAATRYFTTEINSSIHYYSKNLNFEKLIDIENNDRLLLLIDGYEEISSGFKNSFLETLNKFTYDHPKVSVILTSRFKDGFTSLKKFEEYEISGFNTVKRDAFLNKIILNIRNKEDKQLVKETYKKDFINRHNQFLRNPGNIVSSLTKFLKSKGSINDVLLIKDMYSEYINSYDGYYSKCHITNALDLKDIINNTAKSIICYSTLDKNTNNSIFACFVDNCDNDEFGITLDSLENHLYLLKKTKSDYDLMNLEYFEVIIANYFNGLRDEEFKKLAYSLFTKNDKKNNYLNAEGFYFNIHKLFKLLYPSKYNIYFDKNYLKGMYYQYTSIDDDKSYFEFLNDFYPIINLSLIKKMKDFDYSLVSNNLIYEDLSNKYKFKNKFKGYYNEYFDEETIKHQQLVNEYLWEDNGYNIAQIYADKDNSELANLIWNIFSDKCFPLRVEFDDALNFGALIVEGIE